MKINDLKDIYYNNRKVLKIYYNNKEIWNNRQMDIIMKMIMEQQVIK